MADAATSSVTARTPEPPGRRTGVWEVVFLAGLMVAVVALCWPWMTHLGLENDEAHFLPAAVKIAVGSPEKERFPSGLYLFHRPFPFMTAAYIGALDAYLYGLVFALFGVSALTFRLTNLWLSLVLLGATYALARNAAGRVAAVFASLLLAFDLEFLLHAPTNYGPIHLQMLCATFAVLLLYKWMASRAQRHLILAAFLLGLAFTEKLTFMLFLGSLLASLALFYWKPVLAGLRLRSALWAGLAFLLGCLPVLIYTVGQPAIVLGFGRSSAGAPTDLAATLALRYAQFKTMVAGQATFSFMASIPPGLTRFSVLWWGIWFAAACTLAALVMSRLRPSHPAWGPLRACGFFLSLSAGVAVLSSFFPESGRIHHLMLAYPLVHCAVAVAGAWICAQVKASFGPVRLLVFAGLMTPVLAAGASTFVHLRWLAQEAVKTGGRNVWSSEIFDLAAWVRSQPDHHFVFSSWGLYRTVFSLSGGDCSCREYYFQLLPPVLPSAVSDELRAILGRQRAMVVFTRIHPDYAVTSGHIFAAARELNLEPRLVKEFRHPYFGDVLYEAYSFGAAREVEWRPAPAEAARPLHANLREATLAGPAPLVLRARGLVEKGNGLLAMELPLGSSAEYIRFHASSETWDRFTDLTIMLVAQNGEVLRNWHRPFDWSPVTRSELAVEVGPDLYPDYFLSSGDQDGQVASLRVSAGVRSGSGPVALSLSGLEAGTEKR